jgi:hypothetical protein
LAQYKEIKDLKTEEVKGLQEQVVSLIKEAFKFHSYKIYIKN